MLRGQPNVLRLFVHAPFDYCVERAQEVHPSLSREEVKKLIIRTDKRRADYYQYFTGKNWRDADNYDLCINSSLMSWEKSVALVKAFRDINLAP